MPSYNPFMARLKHLRNRLKHAEDNSLDTVEELKRRVAEEEAEVELERQFIADRQRRIEQAKEAL